MKTFGVHNTLKRDDIKSFHILPNISIGVYRKPNKELKCIIFNFRFLNIWVYYKKEYYG